MNKYQNPLLITITLGILTAIGSISIDIYLPAFEVMASYFKVPIVQIESTVTLFLLGMATGQLFIGPISDVWGRRLPLKLGLITYIACSIACLLTTSFEVFLVLRFIQGLSGSACQVVSRALVNDIYTGKDAAHMFTVLQILMGISPILAPIIGGMLADDGLWKLLFLIMAIVSGLGLLGCLTILPGGKLPVQHKKLNPVAVGKAYVACIKNPAFVNFALVRAISNSAAFSFVTASPFVFMELYHLSKQNYGFLFSSGAFGMISMGMLNTRLLRSFEIKTITRFAIIFQVITSSVIVLSIYLQADFIVIAILLFLFLSMLGLILPNSTALYLASASTHGGAASAVIGSLSYLSAFLITSLLTLLHNSTAYPMVITMMSCSLFALLLLNINFSKNLIRLRKNRLLP